MVALLRFSFGESPISSAKLNAIIDTLTGAQNTPISPTGVNDPTNYALTVRNQDAAGKAALLYAADGSTILLQVQNSGVRVSPDGTAAAPAVSTTHTQTLTNKTLTAPTITSPVLSGGAFDPWTAFTPTMTQPGAITLSVANGRYAQFGKFVFWTINLTANSAGTAATQIGMGGLPVNSQQRGIAGAGIYVTAGGTFYEVLCRWNGPATFLLMTGNTNNSLGANPNITVGAGDQLALSGFYETT